MIAASVASGPWDKPTSWVGGKVPGEHDEVVLAATSGNIEVRPGTNCACLSLEAPAYRHALRLPSTGTLRIGGAATGNGGNIINLGAGMKLLGDGEIMLGCNDTTTVQHIKMGGHVFGGEFKIAESSAKYILDEALEVKFLYIVFGKEETGGGEIHFNGHTVRGTEVIELRGGDIYLGSGLVVSPIFQVGILIHTETATVEVPGDGLFNGGAFGPGEGENSFHRVILSGTTGASISGSVTYGTLEILTPLVEVEAGATQTITGALVYSGTGRIESSQAGTPWQIGMTRP